MPSVACFLGLLFFFFFSSRRRHTRCSRDWSSDVCSSDLRSDARVRWVVIAFDRTFDYAKLNTALQAVRGGARLIATNPDPTCPTEEGEIPDCAGMIAAVEAVTGVRVEVIVGKPSPLMLEVALERLGLRARECAMVGDRIETDMVMGKRLGLATVLVLSGITRRDDPRIAEVAPDVVLGSIRELVQTI